MTGKWGFNYTFGDSKAAVNLMGNILQQDEYKRFKTRIIRMLSKQFNALHSLMMIADKNVRETSLKMWHDKFKQSFIDYPECPEVIKTHTLNVETREFRLLLKRSR